MTRAVQVFGWLIVRGVEGGRGVRVCRAPQVGRGQAGEVVSVGDEEHVAVLHQGSMHRRLVLGVQGRDVEGIVPVAGDAMLEPVEDRLPYTIRNQVPKVPEPIETERAMSLASVKNL